MAKKNTEREHQYLRVVITYADGETSGNRVFKLKDRSKAEKWAARQEKSPVVKRVKMEPFAAGPEDWLAQMQKSKDKMKESK